jgi:hypothetical protein
MFVLVEHLHFFAHALVFEQYVLRTIQWAKTVYMNIYKSSTHVQWKPLIMITLGPALFNNNNRLIILSGGYKNLRYLTQFIVTTFHLYKNNKIYLKTSVVLPVVCLHLVVPE